MITITTYDDFAAFYDRVRAYLMEEEAVHTLSLGFLQSWAMTNVTPDDLYMACAEQSGNVAGVVMRVGGFRAIVTRARSSEAVSALAERMFIDQPDTPGALGTQAEARIFVEQWARLSGREYTLNRKERIYRLEQVNPVSGVNGSVRVGTLADLDFLSEWLRDFELEVDPAAVPVPIDNYRRGIRLRLESEPDVRGIWLWEDESKIVSMVGYSGPTPNGIRVGPVYTPPDYRGHGYASALTSAVTQYLLGQGRQFVALYTDLANPTSNKIYQAIGYQPVTDVDEYIFTRNSS